MLRLKRLSEEALCVGHVAEPFDRKRTLEEITRAYRDGDVLAGEDRLIVIDAPATGGHIPISDLSDIQRAVEAFEQMDMEPNAFRSVFVCLNAQFSVAIYVYISLWEARDSLRPKFHRVESLKDAAEILDRPRLPGHPGLLRMLGRH